MRIRILSLLTVLLAAIAFAACGEKEDAYAFCADRGGVNEQTWEPDGDVFCNDFTEYEGDDLTKAGFFKKHKKGTKPKVNRAVLNKVRAQAKVVQARRKAAAAQRKAAESRRRQSQGSSGSSSSSRPRSSGSSGRSSSGGGRRK